MQATDFQIAFAVEPGMQILFITGDEQYWGQTSYATLRSLIDARGGVFAPNITFNAAIAGVEQVTSGNVLARNANAEDPWIVLSGSHGDGVGAGLVLWGEADLNVPAYYLALKEDHLGINVFVSQVPLPAGIFLFAGGLGVVGLLARRKRTAT